MNGRRQEIAHYSDDQVRAHLRDALAIVDDLAVPDDLRVIAFDKVFTALSAKSVVAEPVTPLGAFAIPRGA